jgi:hypothetical protein
MKRKTRMRTNTGSRLSSAILVLLVLLAEPALSAKKPKKASEAAQPFAMIAGTVFRPPGFALPGAQVQVEPESEGKSKKIKTVSDSRGEFAIRVPPVSMKYTVTVTSNGYQAQQKTVAIEGEQRKDLSFQLEPEAK